MNNFLRIVMGCVAFGSAVVATAAPAPVDLLRDQKPDLFALYMANKGYHAGLADYASRQGFRGPVENLATVVHELVHIQSAVHAGYFIDGVYYEPYLKPSAWPALNNREVAAYMAPQERGNIYSQYVLNTPGNNMGNVLDEINAHSHVAGFICANEPDSGSKQVRNITGHLNLLEAYMRVLRLGRVAEYKALGGNRESRGAIVTITARAREALAQCGVAAADIPAREVDYFLKVSSTPAGQKR